MAVAPERRVVRCEEWGRIQIGITGAPLSFDEVGQIFRRWVAQTGTPAEAHFDVRGNTLVPKNWSGIAPGDDVQLEVLPMGATSLAPSQLRVLDRNISLMLQAGLLGASLELGEADLAHYGERLQAILSAFCRLLVRARRKQVIRRYDSIRMVTRCARGRIAFPGQVFESIRRPGYFASEWVSLTEDTAENRFLKAVLSRFSPRATGNLRYRIEDMLCQFDSVSVSSLPMAEWRRIRFDRLSKEYAELLRLARSLLDDEAPGLFSGVTSAAAEIVFTARTFEAFMGVQIERAALSLGYRVTRQQRGQYLGKWSGGTYSGRDVFEIIPDIQVYHTDKELAGCIIDTKWKRLEPGLGQFGISLDDIYQIVAYAIRLGYPCGVLAYPWVGDGNPLGASSSVSLEVAGPRGPIKILVFFVPMLQDGFPDLEERLLNLLRSLADK